MLEVGPWAASRQKDDWATPLLQERKSDWAASEPLWGGISPSQRVYRIWAYRISFPGNRKPTLSGRPQLFLTADGLRG